MIEFDYWNKKRNELKDKLRNDNISDFLTWRFTENTNKDKTIQSRIKNLRGTKYIDIKDTKIGNPKILQDGLTINSIKQLSRLQMFEGKFGEIKEFGSIFEFGSNYGNMCRIIHELGFEGTYEIFELPEYVELCRYFLDSHSINVKYYDDEKLVTKSKRSLFMSMFALCETPIELREQFLNMGYDYIWLGYCDHFDNKINNNKYFDEFIEKHNEYEWERFNDPHAHGREKHLVGIKK